MSIQQSGADDRFLGNPTSLALPGMSLEGPKRRGSIVGNRRLGDEESFNYEASRLEWCRSNSADHTALQRDGPPAYFRLIVWPSLTCRSILEKICFQE